MTIGKGTLVLEELEDVSIDIKVALNNPPLSFLEDNIELLVLTPNTMLNINPTILTELKVHYLEERSLR